MMLFDPGRLIQPNPPDNCVSDLPQKLNISECATHDIGASVVVAPGNTPILSKEIQLKEARSLIFAGSEWLNEIQKPDRLEINVILSTQNLLFVIDQMLCTIKQETDNAR